MKPSRAKEPLRGSGSTSRRETASGPSVALAQDVTCWRAFDSDMNDTTKGSGFIKVGFQRRHTAPWTHERGSSIETRARENCNLQFDRDATWQRTLGISLRSAVCQQWAVTDFASEGVCDVSVHHDVVACLRGSCMQRRRCFAWNAFHQDSSHPLLVFLIPCAS